MKFSIPFLFLVLIFLSSCEKNESINPNVNPVDCYDGICDTTNCDSSCYPNPCDTSNCPHPSCDTNTCDTTNYNSNCDPRPALIGTYTGMRRGYSFSAGYYGGGSQTNYPDTTITFLVGLSGTDVLELPDGTIVSLINQTSDFYHYEHRNESNNGGYSSSTETWSVKFYPANDSIAYSFSSYFSSYGGCTGEEITFNGLKQS